MSYVSVVVRDTSVYYHYTSECPFLLIERGYQEDISEADALDDDRRLCGFCDRFNRPNVINDDDDHLARDTGYIQDDLRRALAKRASSLTDTETQLMGWLADERVPDVPELIESMRQTMAERGYLYYRQMKMLRKLAHSYGVSARTIWNDGMSGQFYNFFSRFAVLATKAMGRRWVCLLLDMSGGSPRLIS